MRLYRGAKVSAQGPVTRWLNWNMPTIAWLILIIGAILLLLFGCGGATATIAQDPCQVCFSGCDDPDSDVSAYRCVWHCNEVCAAVRDR